MTTASPAPRLIADIGSLHARLVLERAPGRLVRPQVLRCAEHADLAAALSAYLARAADAERPVRDAVVAIANPVAGDAVDMPNGPWRFSIEATRRALGLRTLLVVNDFTALAMALPGLHREGLRAIGGGQAVPRSVIGLIGPGSGLGMSGLVPAGDGWVSLASEGGHATVAPRDEAEWAVVQHAARRFGHVSFERLLSGPGLSLMHEALALQDGADATPLPPTEVTRRALAGECARCSRVLALFAGLLGSAAANLALTLGATGGVVIAGAIVPRLGDWLDGSPFRARFEDHGRFSAWLAGVPTSVVTDERATWRGAALILDAQLRARLAEGGTGGDTLLARVRAAQPALSRAEARVAAEVLARPHALLDRPVAEIALAAGVSQPTVIRFCRSLGLNGLADFKRRLATGLAGTLPIGHVQLAGDAVGRGPALATPPAGRSAPAPAAAQPPPTLGSLLDETAAAIAALRARLPAG